MANYQDLAYTSLETITAFDPVTGALMWTLDELQDCKIANTEDTKDITGKAGRLLNRIKQNKGVTISGNNGLVSGNLMSTQVGGSFETKETTVMYPDYVTVKDNAAVTTYVATGTTGNEIGSIVVQNSDNTAGKTLTQDSIVSEGKFTYAPASKTITFYDGEIENGTEIAVYYTRKIQADVLENLSDQYSGKAELYVDGFAEDKCNNVYRIQFHIPRADFSGNFDLDMGSDQTVHAFEASSLSTACGGSSSKLWTYTIYGEDTVDIA